jgi:hypothetical protein
MCPRRGNSPFSKTGVLTLKFSVQKFLPEFFLHWLCNLLEGMLKNLIGGILIKDVFRREMLFSNQ